jgi:hypothetical protein
MIDELIQWMPQIGVLLGFLAVVLAFLKWSAPKTETDIDDKIVDAAERTGIAAFLSRFNPFKK